MGIAVAVEERSRHPITPNRRTWRLYVEGSSASSGGGTTRRKCGKVPCWHLEGLLISFRHHAAQFANAFRSRRAHRDHVARLLELLPIKLHSEMRIPPTLTDLLESSALFT